MQNKSYQQIKDQFDMLFPEFKQSVKEWTKCEFNSRMRVIKINLKNGCYIYFGTWRDEEDDWVWIANLEMSDKTHDKLGITTEE